MAGPPKKTIDPAKMLDNAQDEQFVQLIASGSNQAAAYEAVWGKVDRSHASRKARYPHINARIQWLRNQGGQAVVEKIAAVTAEVTIEAIKRADLTRTYVIETLQRNIAIAMGDEKVRVEKQLVKADGSKETAIAYVTMRDAGAANRALEMLGKEIGLFDGEGKRDADQRDSTEKAPIRTMSDEKAVTFLERYRAGRTPAAILGKKFRQANEGKTA